VEVAEGAVEQLHGAVDEMVTAAAGQNDAEIFHGSEAGKQFNSCAFGITVNTLRQEDVVQSSPVVCRSCVGRV